MKRVLLIIIAITGCLYAMEQVVVYNNDLALIKKEITIENLSKGINDFSYDDITSRINPKSVIFMPKKGSVSIIEQNYEYDLGNTDSILKKYMGKTIKVETIKGNKFEGELQFNDGISIGLKSEDGTISLVGIKEIENISLVKMPENFYLKPTLKWKLESNNQQTVKVDISYLTGGFSWEAVYNMVWDDEKLRINSWISMDNNSGKALENVKLKLIAGDINLIEKDEVRFERYAKSNLLVTSSGIPIEQDFHDYHMYTVTNPVNIKNNQSKQLQLYETKEVNAKQVYKYNSYSSYVTGYLKFKNSKKDGLGIPLPGGNVMVYMEDKTDNEMALIGETAISHTPINEEVELETGKAFDLKAETIEVNKHSRGLAKYQRDMKITLKNRSKYKKTIEVLHNFDHQAFIKSSNHDFKEVSAGKISFSIELEPNQVKDITFTEIRD